MNKLESRVNYDLQRPAGVYERRMRIRDKLRGESSDGFASWRSQYVADAERLGINLLTIEDGEGIVRPDLTKPNWDTLKEYVGSRVASEIERKGAEKIIVGISGDADSSALVALLGEFIRDNSLPYTIEAFYLKREHHPARVRRIEELINYLNRGANGVGGNVIDGNLNRKIVNFHVFDMNYAFRLILDSLVSSNGQFSFPSNEDALRALGQITDLTMETLNGLGKVGSDASKRARKKMGIPEEDLSNGNLIEELRSGRTEMDIPADQIVNIISRLMEGNGDSLETIRRKIDPREESNLIHEILVLLRGYLSRKNGKVLTLGGQQFSELVIENYTTADTLVNDIPMANIPKTVLISAFREYISDSNGGINIDSWEARPFQYLVPYYPCGIGIEEADGGRVLTRKPNYLQEFTQVFIDTSTSAIPEEVWHGIRPAEGKNYIEIDGRIHWYIDPYLHYFMINGLNESSVEELCEQFPRYESDIRFAALLMAAARDRRGKKISSMLQSISPVDQVYKDL